MIQCFDIYSLDYLEVRYLPSTWVKCRKQNQSNCLSATQSNTNTPSSYRQWQTGTIWRTTSSKQALPVHLHQHWTGQYRLLPKAYGQQKTFSQFLNKIVVATQWDSNKHGSQKWKWRPYIKTTNFAFSLFRHAYSHWLAPTMYISRSNTSFLWPGHTSDAQTSTTVAPPSNTCDSRAFARTGWSSVSIPWLGESTSLSCSFSLCGVADKTISAGPSMRYTLPVAGMWSHQKTNKTLTFVHAHLYCGHCWSQIKTSAD